MNSSHLDGLLPLQLIYIKLLLVQYRPPQSPDGELHEFVGCESILHGSQNVPRHAASRTNSRRCCELPSNSRRYLWTKQQVAPAKRPLQYSCQEAHFWDYFLDFKIADVASSLDATRPAAFDLFFLPSCPGSAQPDRALVPGTLFSHLKLIRLQTEWTVNP